MSRCDPNCILTTKRWNICLSQGSLLKNNPHFCSAPRVEQWAEQKSHEEINSSIFRAGPAQCTVNTGQGCTMSTGGKTKHWEAAYYVGVFHLESPVRQRCRGENNTDPVSKSQITTLQSRGLSWHCTHDLNALTKSVFKGCWNGSCEHALTNCRQESAELV